MGVTTAERTGNRWIAAAEELATTFAERAARFDKEGRFVEENSRDLKAAGLYAAAIPSELGGGGASYRDLCEILRILGQACGSTSLTFSMHSHLLAALVWRWRNQNAPVEPLLRRIASEQLILVSTGGSDWLNGSGSAERADGGYRITGQKIFSSGCLNGDLLMTTAVLNDAEKGSQVLHFPIPMKSEGVKILETWDTLGMRGSGSHNVELNSVFVPESSVGVRRPQGQWHPSMHVVAKIALPLIYSSYMGVAEAARPIVLREAAKRRNNPDVPLLVGEMENELTAARLAWERLVAIGADADPGSDTTNQVMILRTLVARSAIKAVERGMEALGGLAFYRSIGLERLFRDIQGARFHPLQEFPQRRQSGKHALGLPENDETSG